MLLVSSSPVTAPGLPYRTQFSKFIENKPRKNVLKRVEKANPLYNPLSLEEHTLHLLTFVGIR